jgi:glycosyltransferase involved in cell wall biosynthesis
MNSNKGTYITTNTIMKKAKYENLFRFDSDDIMCPNLVETIMNKKEDCSYVRYRLKNFGGSVKVSVACGTVYLTKTLFEKCGGYRPWPCAADDELYYRIKFDENTKVLNDVLMYRRCHPNSLTQSKETGIKSEKRRPYREIVHKMKNSNKPIVDFKIECITNTFKEIKIENKNKEEKEKYIETLSTKDWSNELYKDTEEKNTIVRENINERYSKIMKLRKDIANGKIVKVYTGDGKFVWKRIK